MRSTFIQYSFGPIKWTPVLIPPEQWFSTRASFVPLANIWQYLKTFLVVTVGVKVILIASREERPGTLLKFL